MMFCHPAISAGALHAGCQHSTQRRQSLGSYAGSRIILGIVLSDSRNSTSIGSDGINSNSVK